jgi:hypothetical protein
MGIRGMSIALMLPFDELARRLSAAAVRKAAKEGRLRAIGGFRVLFFSARSVRAFARGDTGPAESVDIQPSGPEGCNEAEDDKQPH